MGLCASTAAPISDEDMGAIDASNDVDLQLLETQIKELFKFKVLLLGAGESGKSTVVKQIKLIHRNKISQKDLAMVGTSLHQNVVDCIKALLQAVRTFGTHALDDEDQKTELYLMQHDENQRLSPEMGERLLRLWESEAVQAAYGRRDEFWLLDSFPYYIAHLRRFCEEDFVPNEEDNVMARIRTTGIVETQLESKIVKEHRDEPDSLSFLVVDVGGQRNERKKWIHCFADVAAILFVVNLAGYNQVMFEDNSKNRMEEELELFDTIVNNPIFTDTPVFLFLNKKDIFETMIKEKDMRHVFEDYKGGRDLDKALDYIQATFRKKLPPGKSVHMEIVTASYRKDIKIAFDNIKKMLYDFKRKTLLERVRKIRQQQHAIILDKARQAQACCRPRRIAPAPPDKGPSAPGAKYEEDEDV